MKLKIVYVDDVEKEYDGDYEIHDTYISCRIPTFRDERYEWYDVVIPIHTIKHFEAHW